MDHLALYHRTILLLLLFILLSHLVAGSCVGSTCEECTKDVSCVWCTQPNQTSPHESYTTCIAGDPAGSHDVKCSSYYWLQCTVSSQSIGNDYTYVIGLVLIGVLLLILIGLIVTIVKVCRGNCTCTCCERKLKPTNKKPGEVGLKKNKKKGKDDDEKLTTTASSTVKMTKQEDDDLHRTLMRNCLDKMDTSTTVPVEVQTLREQQSSKIIQPPQQSTPPEPKSPRLDVPASPRSETPKTPRAETPKTPGTVVRELEAELAQPHAGSGAGGALTLDEEIGVIDLVAESKKIADDLDEILRELAGTP